MDNKLHTWTDIYLTAARIVEMFDLHPADWFFVGGFPLHFLTGCPYTDIDLYILLSPDEASGNYKRLPKKVFGQDVRYKYKEGYFDVSIWITNKTYKDFVSSFDINLSQISLHLGIRDCMLWGTSEFKKGLIEKTIIRNNSLDEIVGATKLWSALRKSKYNLKLSYINKFNYELGRSYRYGIKDHHVETPDRFFHIKNLLSIC